MNIIVHFCSIVVLSILIMSDLAKCDTFFDTVPPVIIVGNTETEHSLFSYALAGKSASGQNLSKFFIGRSSSKAEESEKSSDILQCSLNLRKILTGSGTNELNCIPFSNHPIYVPNAYACQQGSSRSSDTRYSSAFGNTIKYDNQNNRNRLLICDYKWRQYPKSPQDSTSTSPVRGLCYQTNDNNLGISNVVISTNYTRSKNDLLYYALLGFSADFSGSHFVLGTPGYLNYQGGVVSITRQESSRCVSPTNDVQTLEGLAYYDYFGYSMTAGTYFLRGVRNHAIGTPRGSTGKGQVIIVRLDGYFSRILDLTGDKFGSYFGSVLASTDINGDGFDDLFVGAPMYTTEAYDEGCVFIFSQLVSRSQTFPATGTRLCPSRTPGGRFGTSIAPLGDINEDGLGDVAISAPFGDTTGRVYIYYGARSGSMSPIEIKPSPLQPEIKGFGTTVLGQVDLDGNGTPDIAIGSYVSKSISVYLTRPRVILSVSFGDRSSQPTKYTRGVRNFKLSPSICAEHKLRNNRLLPKELQVWVKVVADSQVAPDKRRFVISAVNGTVVNQQVAEFQLDLSKRDNGNSILCGNPWVIITAPNDLKPNDTEKIVFDWKVWYNETSKEFTSTETIKITNNGQPTRSENSNQKGFCSRCPAPTEEFGTTNAVQLSDHCDEDNIPSCNPDLKIIVKFMDNLRAELKEITIGTVPTVLVEITIKNEKETAYIRMINVSLTTDSTSFDLGKLQTDQCVTNNNNDNSGQSVEMSCTRDFTIHKNQEEKLTVSFKLKDIKAQPQPVKISVQVKVPTLISADANSTFDQFSSLEESLHLKSKVNLELLLMKPIEGHIADTDKTEFDHKFRVKNSEASTPSSVEIAFKFPHKYESNSIVTLLSITSFTGNINCSNSQPNPVESTATNRRKRDVKEAKSSDAVDVRIPPKGSSAVWGCDEKNWKCEIINCIGYFSENNPKEFEITLKYQINSTLARKLKLINSETMKLEVKTHGSMKQFGSEKDISAVVSQTFIIANDKGGPTAIELIAAGGIGLILLFLIVVGLFKCGFFRRKTREELEALKAQTEEEENLAKNFPARGQSNDENDE